MHFKNQKLDGNTIKITLEKWALLKIKEVPKSIRNYQTFIKTIKAVPNPIIREPEIMREYLLDNHPKEQSKRILTKIKAGFEWSVKCGIFTKNIYENVSKIHSKQQIIPINGQLVNILKEAKKFNSNSELIFPNKSGGYLNLHNLSNRGWQKIIINLRAPIL